MLDIAVIDYGMGNLHSVASALHKVAPQLQVAITSDETQIRQAKRVILPGVGAIRDCMAEIRRLGIDELVREVVSLLTVTFRLMESSFGSLRFCPP